MPYISAKLHRERIARAELGRHLCSAQWLNNWTCENGLQQCRAWSGRPQGSPLSPWHISSPRATARVPTPLHTAPALTMTTKGSWLAADHSKGGGGVGWGGDPCG